MDNLLKISRDVDKYHVEGHRTEYVETRDSQHHPPLGAECLNYWRRDWLFVDRLNRRLREMKTDIETRNTNRQPQAYTASDDNTDVRRVPTAEPSRVPATAPK